MQIPTDVFNHVVLPYAPLNVVRYYRTAVPETYVQRSEQSNDRFSQLLVAIANDDIDLFTASFDPYTGRGMIGSYICHLVANIAADPTTVVFPERILNFLLKEWYGFIGDHIYMDMQLITNNLQRQGLVRKVRELVKKDIKWSGTEPQQYLQMLRTNFTDKADNGLLAEVDHILVGDFLAEHNPKRRGVTRISKDLRQQYQDLRTDILNRFREHGRNDYFEEIRSLNDDTETVTVDNATFTELLTRRMWGLKWSHRWVAAINDPTNYPELARVIIDRGDISHPYMYEYLDLMEGSIVRPDLLVQALYDFVHGGEVVTNNHDSKFAYFVARHILGIPFGDSPYDDGMDEQDANSDQESPIPTPFNEKIKRQVAQTILSLFPSKDDTIHQPLFEDDFVGDHEFTRFYDKILQMAQ
jgi:hypothetical protein